MFNARNANEAKKMNERSVPLSSRFFKSTPKKAVIERRLNLFLQTMHSLFLGNLETLVAYFAVINLYWQQGHEAKNKRAESFQHQGNISLSIFGFDTSLVIFHPLDLFQSLSPTCLPGWFRPWNIAAFYFQHF